MKKFLFPFIVILALFAGAGCSTKFNVAAPYKNITIVYGLLDRADTAHYIRIEKAFLDQNKSAITMAQNPDSSYYANINVRMELVDFMNSGAIIDTYHLNKVDLNLEGYPKQPGVFFTAPNYAYKFKTNLNPNYSYRIVITNQLTGDVDSAEAPVIDDVNSSTFYVRNIDNVITNLAGMDFSSTLPGHYYEVIGNYGAPSSYNFYGQTSPVAIAEGIIQFNWIDSNTLTGAETQNSYQFNIGYQTVSSATSNEIDYKIDDYSLYAEISSAMGTAPPNIDRLLQRCDLSVYLGTPDFYSYLQISETQGTGLTANEIEPIYTNIQGANALGIFTSRGLRTGKIAISSTTLDSLRQNPLTQPANITGFAQ